MDKGGKEGSFKPFMIFMVISLAIAFFWNTFSWIKDPIHAALDPSVGVLLNWNILYGMLILVAGIALLTTVAQKYGTDQATLKELKKQQKEISTKAKEFRHDPQKALEIQKELGPITMKMFKLSSRMIIFTGIPILLLYRWFMDYFLTIGSPKVFWIFNWFWFYLIFVIVFSMIFRKLFKVV